MVLALVVLGASVVGMVAVAVFERRPARTRRQPSDA
jgi:hypothetical protein